MPTYEYICPLCGRRGPRAVSVAQRDQQLCMGVPASETYLGVCRGTLERLPAAPNFTIKGFNAKNGYSK